MPCEDVTELLRVVIDAEDRLLGYELIKRTCGRAVGERSLLLERWQGTEASVITALDSDRFAEEIDTGDETELVLQMKHFFAVQSGVRVLLGMDPGGAFDPVRVASVGSGENGTFVLEAEIAVDVLTEKIQACGRCSGCGVKSRKG